MLHLHQVARSSEIVTQGCVKPVAYRLLQLVSFWCRIMPDVIADAFEALVGAIYLDKGFKVATEFLIRVAEVGHSILAASPEQYSLGSSALNVLTVGEVCTRCLGHLLSPHALSRCTGF